MLNVIIPTDHPDADSPLLWAAAHALERMGARVVIDEHGENLVRSLVGDDSAAPTGDAASAPCALVQAQGLPNLLHELVHAVQAGRLDDDHGIDYGAIPFALDTEAGRAMLWDELACCVISCAYLWSQGSAARAKRDEAAIEAEVDDWFAEQVEIQPVFYGMESEPSAFHRRVEGLLVDHADEVETFMTRAYAATEHALGQTGATTSLCAAPRRLTVDALWPRARARLFSTGSTEPTELVST